MLWNQLWSPSLFVWPCFSLLKTSHLSPLVRSNIIFWLNKTPKPKSICCVSFCGPNIILHFISFYFVALLLFLSYKYLSSFCISFTRSMYVFGGFSGVLLNDVLVYRPPSCQAFLAEEGCVKAGPGVRCIWSRGRCLPWEPSMANGSLIPAPFCPPKAGEEDNRTFLLTC